MRALKHLTLACLAVLALAVAAPEFADAQAVSESDIIEALTRKSGSIPGRRSARVNFAYDSDRLENEALLTLNTLGRALSSEKLAGQTFEIVGHTDAKGSFEYNDDLSERRAAAVVSYLTTNFGLDRTRISSRGMGKRRLLDEANPFDELNRRVEIRNVSGPD